MSFDERWLSPCGVVPVDVPTTGELIREIQRLRALQPHISHCDACGFDYYSGPLCDGCGVTLLDPSQPQGERS